MSGWRRNAFAFACGALATLALPPFFLFPLLIPAFANLYWLVANAPSDKRAFADGWWWGWGFYISGLYWFCIALLTDPEKFAWLIPFALFALTAIIALYSGVACWLWKLTRTRGLTGILVFSVIWTCVEYARGHLFTGFPWNLAGYSFAFSDALLQPASLVGVYGLTWFAVLLATIPAALGDQHIARKKAFMAIAAAYAMLTVAGIWGASQLKEETAYVPDVHLRLVQANVAQHQKWDPAFQMQGVEEYMRLTQSTGLNKITHVIWPETAVPFAINQNQAIARAVGKILPPSAMLITGGLRVEGDIQNWRIFNSIAALASDGSIISAYDKNKLVPFGEFVPFRNFFPDSWLTPVGPKDFARGPGAQIVSWPGLPPVAPLICYEVIFPEYMTSGERPRWLLNLTNDAWFGLSSGPYQHFHMARLRTIEQGIPLIRVANTGITAAIDHSGRIIASLALEKRGVLDIGLPQSKPVPTLYSKYGDVWIWGLMVLGVILTLHQRYVKDN